MLPVVSLGTGQASGGQGLAVPGLQKGSSALPAARRTALTRPAVDQVTLPSIIKETRNLHLVSVRPVESDPV